MRGFSRVWSEPTNRFCKSCHQGPEQPLLCDLHAARLEVAVDIPLMVSLLPRVAHREEQREPRWRRLVERSYHAPNAPGGKTNRRPEPLRHSVPKFSSGFGTSIGPFSF